MEALTLLAPRYFMQLRSGKLYVDRHMPERFEAQPDDYVELTEEKYEEYKAEFARRRAAFRGLSEVHHGATIHVIGCGPSLHDYAARQDWTGKLTIGMSACGLYVKPLTYWLDVHTTPFVGDNRHADPLDRWIMRWLESVRGKTLTFGRFMTLYQKRSHEWMPDFCFDYDRYGPTTEATTVGGKTGLFYSATTAHAALDLACHLGAARVVLWGMDFHFLNHCYTGSPEIPYTCNDAPHLPWCLRPGTYRSLLRGFDVLEGRYPRVKIINANPNSRLKMFPVRDPERAFRL